MLIFCQLFDPAEKMFIFFKLKRSDSVPYWFICFASLRCPWLFVLLFVLKKSQEVPYLLHNTEKLWTWSKARYLEGLAGWTFLGVLAKMTTASEQEPPDAPPPSHHRPEVPGGRHPRALPQQPGVQSSSSSSAPAFGQATQVVHSLFRLPRFWIPFPQEFFLVGAARENIPTWKQKKTCWFHVCKKNRSQNNITKKNSRHPQNRWFPLSTMVANIHLGSLLCDVNIASSRL